MIKIIILSMCMNKNLIKNIEKPSCVNCIYYNKINKYEDICEKFGEKNIITGEIKKKMLMNVEEIMTNVE